MSDMSWSKKQFILDLSLSVLNLLAIIVALIGGQPVWWIVIANAVCVVWMGYRAVKRWKEMKAWKDFI